MALSREEILSKCLEKGDVEMAKAILPLCLPLDTKQPFKDAVKHGHAGIVEDMLPHVGWEVVDAAWLEYVDASSRGHKEVVQLRSSHYEPEVLGRGLREAAHHGHLDVVQYLLPIAEDEYFHAVHGAASNGYAEVVEALFNHHPGYLSLYDGRELSDSSLEPEVKVVIEKHRLLRDMPAAAQAPSRKHRI